MNAIKYISPLFLLFPVGLFAQGAPLPPQITAGVNWLENLTTIVNNLIDTKGGLEVANGSELLAFLGVLELAFLVIRWAKHSTTGGGGSPAPLIVDTFTVLVSILLCALLLAFYMQPLPGTSLSLHQIPTYIALQLSTQFDSAIIQDFLANVNAVVNNLNQPSSPFDFLGIEIYIGMLLNMALLDIAMFTINSFGFVMIAILTLFGPLFIPLVITKHFSRLFWHWVDQLVVFAMYRAVAAGVTLIWCTMLVTFFDNSVARDYSLGNFIALLPTVLLLNVSFLYGMFKIPSISSSLFGGAGAMGADWASDLKAVAIGFLV